MKKNLVLAISLSLTLTTLFTGCGTGNTPTPATEESSIDTDDIEDIVADEEDETDFIEYTVEGGRHRITFRYANDAKLTPEDRNDEGDDVYQYRYNSPSQGYILVKFAPNIGQAATVDDCYYLNSIDEAFNADYENFSVEECMNSGIMGCMEDYNSKASGLAHRQYLFKDNDEFFFLDIGYLSEEPFPIEFSIETL